MPRDRSDNVIEIDVSTDADTVLPQQEAASFMATFWDRVITEFNVAKSLSNAASIQALPDNSDALPPPQPFEKQDSDALFSSAEDIGPRQKLGKKGERENPSPESLSYEALSHCLLGGLEEVSEDEEERCWKELDEICSQCGRLGEVPGPASTEERRAYARKLFVVALVE